MRQLKQQPDPNLLVGTATADDAAVYRLNRQLALVQTVDFFTPVVDDPFLYGQIAAANSLSDVYAMGGRPLTALNLLGVPADILPPAVIHQILRGGASKAREAKCLLVGGHTIRNPEPIYGLSVLGTVSPSKMITNAGAKPGDWLVLTKPLGIGIVTTGIKREAASARLASKAVRLMNALNTAGPVLGEAGLIRGGTDITGFGLLGHLSAMCRASGVGAVLGAAQLPALDPEVWALIAAGCIPGGSRDNLETANDITVWGDTASEIRALAADAQTSGGLLLAVPPRRLAPVLKILRGERAPIAVVIGRIEASRRPRIWFEPDLDKSPRKGLPVRASRPSA